MRASWSSSAVGAPRNTPYPSAGASPPVSQDNVTLPGVKFESVSPDSGMGGAGAVDAQADAVHDERSTETNATSIPIACSGAPQVPRPAPRLLTFLDDSPPGQPRRSTC